MKRIFMGLLALGASAAMSAAIASPAAAADHQAPDTAAQCSAVADENRSVWAEPGTGGGEVGSVTAGQSYTAECATVEGESSTACGGTTSQWALLNYTADEWGYVPSTCVTWAS